VLKHVLVFMLAFGASTALVFFAFLYNWFDVARLLH